MRKKIVPLLLTAHVVLTACEALSNNDLLEFFYGIHTHSTSIDATTVFFYDEASLYTFNMSTPVYIRLDFLYIPERQSKDDTILVQMVFPDSPNYFLTSTMGRDLEGYILNQNFYYDLIINKNTYHSFYFLIEVSSPSRFALQVSSMFRLNQINKNTLNENPMSDEEVRIVNSGKSILLSEFEFI
jgi:hypothetical protein